MKEKRYFKCSVSVEGYENKVLAETCVKGEALARRVGRHKTIFKEVEISVDDFVELVTSGHTFCGLFKHKDKEVGFDAYKKSGDNYIGSQLVCVDIDETRYESMDEYIEKLSYPPTIGYYSFSDGKKGKKGKKGSRHFRLVYVLNRVYSREEIVLLYYTLATQIVYDTDEKIKDNCGGVVEQCIFGTKYKDVYVNKGAIYDISDIDLVGCEEEAEKVSEGAKSLICGAVPEPKRIFIWDMNHLTYEQFMGKYWGMGYRCIWQTQYADYEEVPGLGIRYAETSEEHLKLYYNRDKMQDGDKRRKTLYKRMCLRRLMKPDITIEEMLYCAMIDRYKFIDNSDGVVSNECLIRNAKNAFRLTGEAIGIKYKRSVDWCKEHRSKFVISDDVPNKRKCAQKVRKWLTDSKIGEVYDVNKSVAMNLSAMQEMGIEVKQRRLYQWCKEHQIDTKQGGRKQSERQKQNAELAGMYDLGLTEKENAERLGISNSKAHRVKCSIKNEK